MLWLAAEADSGRVYSCPGCHADQAYRSCCQKGAHLFFSTIVLADCHPFLNSCDYYRSAYGQLFQDGLPQAHHTQSQLNHTLPGPRDDEHERRAIAAAAPNASAVWNRLAEGSAHGGATESTVR